MKALIFGKNGQVGRELFATLPASVNAIFLGRDDCDVTDEEQLAQQIETHSPTLLINASAYTKVDQAEVEKSEAYAINCDSVRFMGELCAKANIRFIHISTDFVFDGQNTEAYVPEAHCAPVNIYGASKHAGEVALTTIADLDYLIVRTAWVYSCHGKNFVKTMLKLMQSRPEISVVNNQIGTPTWAKALAKWIWQVSQHSHFDHRILHWTDAGVASWYDFAYGINEIGVQEGLLQSRVKINPIPDSEYPTPARRPQFSLLNTVSAQQLSCITPEHWTSNLRAMLRELNTGSGTSE